MISGELCSMPAIGRIVHNEAQSGNNPIHTPRSVSPGAISALQRLDFYETTTDIALSYWLTVYIYTLPNFARSTHPAEVKSAMRRLETHDDLPKDGDQCDWVAASWLHR